MSTELRVLKTLVRGAYERFLKPLLRRLFTLEVLLLGGFTLTILHAAFPNVDSVLRFCRKIYLGACISAPLLAPLVAFEGWGHLIERISIVLDLCAGFLIAPELIGKERISRLEKWTREKLQQMTNWWARAARVGGNEPLDVVFTIIGAYFVSIFGYIFQVGAYEGDTGLRVLIGAVYLYAAYEGTLSYGGAVGALKGVIICFLILTFSWLVIPWVVVCQVLLSITTGLLMSLTGNERLQSYMVIFGIIAFILAKTLALLATFI
jgi:hypothetical protein